MKTKDWIIIILVAVSAFFIYRASIQDYKLKEQTNLVSSLSDGLEIWKDKDSVTHARIETIKTGRTKDFIRLQSADSTITALQEVVQKYKKELRKKGSAVILNTGTTYDTIYKTDTLLLPNDSIRFDKRGYIHNAFINSTFGFIGDSTYFTLTTRDRFAIVLGEERNGLFKKRIPFAEITSESPYTEVKTFRVYQVADRRKKRYGVGPVAAYGLMLNGIPQLGGFIGFGVQYTLFKF